MISCTNALIMLMRVQSVDIHG